MNLTELKSKIPEIFEEVKKDVKSVLGRHRAGLSLGFADMGITPTNIVGGMYLYPGTEIVLNITPLEIMLKSQSYDIVWAYMYHLLLNLYLKSLGILDEIECKHLTSYVSKEIFKKADHPAIIMAEKGFGYYIPNNKIIYMPPASKPDGISTEYKKCLNKESKDYFS
ncbi:MAG: hypothetical protein EAX91_04580 [Candidatus Lokiarchaeota archaeon]|nr:hypothetical protein [Candidatus Lokiarchaeota archaeon]